MVGAVPRPTYEGGVPPPRCDAVRNQAPWQPTREADDVVRTPSARRPAR